MMMWRGSLTRHRKRPAARMLPERRVRSERRVPLVHRSTARAVTVCWSPSSRSAVTRCSGSGGSSRPSRCTRRRSHAQKSRGSATCGAPYCPQTQPGRMLWRSRRRSRRCCRTGRLRTRGSRRPTSHSRTRAALWYSRRRIARRITGWARRCCCSARRRRHVAAWRLLRCWLVGRRTRMGMRRRQHRHIRRRHVRCNRRHRLRPNLYGHRRRHRLGARRTFRCSVRRSHTGRRVRCALPSSVPCCSAQCRGQRSHTLCASTDSWAVRHHAARWGAGCSCPSRRSSARPPLTS